MSTPTTPRSSGSAGSASAALINKLTLGVGTLLMENRLRVLRAERNWSQQDLADRLEVSRQSVNAIETGKYDPSLPLAFRIAELFDLPIEDIFVSPSRRSSNAI